MNTQWTAQDVERCRAQQRWRLRQKTHAPRSHSQPPQQLHRPLGTNNQQQHDDGERARKVSLKFRREHEQFAAKQQRTQALSPRATALAVTLRPAFSIALPSVGRPLRTAESPLPHTAYSMFNAFDSAASPEAFALARQNHSNQDERHPVEPEDHEMASEDEREVGHNEDDDAAAGSLWRRRLHVQGMEKRAPKLGRVALWDAAGGMVALDDACGSSSNQAAEMVRLPLPFADDDCDDLF